MDQVAEVSGVSKVVLYRTFPSKSELVAAIAAEARELLQREAQEPWSGYGTGLSRALKALRVWPSAFIVLLRDMPSDPEYAGHYQEFTHVTQRDLLALIDGNALKTAQALQTASALASAMTSLIHQAVLCWIVACPPGEDDHLIAWAATMTKAWRRATLLAIAAKHDSR